MTVFLGSNMQPGEIKAFLGSGGEEIEVTEESDHHPDVKDLVKKYRIKFEGEREAEDYERHEFVRFKT